MIMDPDATLAEIRALLATNWRIVDNREKRRLRDLVAALDTWLSGGGFPPESWPGARAYRPPSGAGGGEEDTEPVPSEWVGQ